MQTALINKRLNAAEPTIVDGPSSPAFSPSVPTVSSTDSKISGADDPRAIKERFAIVAFQTGTSTQYILSVFLSYTSLRYVFDVIVSIASMKMSAMIAIPRNRYIRKKKYTPAKKLMFNSYMPGILIRPLKHYYSL